MEYTELINEKIGKLMTDEISAATMYIEAAQYITDLELAEEIKTHGQEEFEHFQELMQYAISHNLKTNYDFDRTVIKNVPRDTKTLTRVIQNLEKKAIANYREIALIARDNNDIESEQFFMSLMRKEMEHFDDVAQKTGEHRRLGESLTKFKKFKNEFNKSKGIK